MGEIYRYWLRNPVDANGREIYTLSDMKSLQDWTLEREFRRVPRIADVVSFGGRVKRYEVQPDPERLRRFDITLDQLQQAITSSNMNAGGDYLLQPQSVQVVRGLGLIGDGVDPVSQVITLKDPSEAGQRIRDEESKRLNEIRQIVLATTNNVPIRIGDIVEGGTNQEDSNSDQKGIVVGNLTPQGRVSVSVPSREQPAPAAGENNPQRQWENHSDVVQGVVLLRKGEQSLPALADVKAKVDSLNNSGALLPGVKIEVFDDRTNLIHKTTETVNENLLVGMALVTFVLLIFLNHFPTAMIVAINIPLALLFAFALMYFRGLSANLLSLGAVDFGIIVDSSVIMVERIYSRLSSTEGNHQSIDENILKAAGEVHRPLMYSTLIMVCALLPLFTMAGPEGQIFGPMADAYAFALGGALLLALTLSPVLCRTFLGRVKVAKENFLVRALKQFYLRQFDLALRYRTLVIGAFLVLLVGTAACLPFLGREFMPELEEGNVYIRGTFPAGVSLDEVARQVTVAQEKLQHYPEARAVLVQLGRPDDGTDPTGFYNAEIFVPLMPEDQWPLVNKQTGLTGFFWPQRHRTKLELIESMQRDLDGSVVGVDWNFSQSIRDNVMETLSGVKGENSLKIFGPDLRELERKAQMAANALRT